MLISELGAVTFIALAVFQLIRPDVLTDVSEWAHLRAVSDGAD
jgi:hypothetical protein